MGRASRRKRERAAKHMPIATSAPSRRKRITRLAIGTCAALALVAAIIFSIKPPWLTGGSPRQPMATTLVKFEPGPTTLNDLLALDPAKLAGLHIARVNLLCAEGLPGAEKLNVEHALATLDQWAQRVKFETDRHLYRVTDPRYADHYRHSEAYLRAEFLVQVLCEDLGVKYDMAAKDNFSFNDSRVAFIHGMIPKAGQTVKDTPGGTCASMPVMVTAVGRRLGYPLKLVTTRGHVFVRWDGKDHPNPTWRERFNMEVTNGFNSFEDEYYKTWPFKVTDQEVQADGYLASLTPQEELAQFMAARGHCGLDNGQIAFAARCYENAYRYDTARPAYRAWFLDAARKSGYQPDTAALVQALAQRPRPAVVRRDPMAMPMPSEMAADAASDPLGVVPVRLGQWQQPPAGRPPFPGAPQPGRQQVPGVPQPYQPPTPGVPGQPPVP